MHRSPDALPQGSAKGGERPDCAAASKIGLFDPARDLQAVAAGGQDFSGTVEVADIFGFGDMAGVADFVDQFATHRQGD